MIGSDDRLFQTDRPSDPGFDNPSLPAEDAGIKTAAGLSQFQTEQAFLFLTAFPYGTGQSAAAAAPFPYPGLQLSHPDTGPQIFSPQEHDPDGRPVCVFPQMVNDPVCQAGIRFPVLQNQMGNARKFHIGKGPGPGNLNLTVGPGSCRSFPAAACRLPLPLLPL